MHDPIGQDKEGNEISLIDVLKSEAEDVFDTIQLNMELETGARIYQVLDDREKEVIVGRFGLNLKRNGPSVKLPKSLVYQEATSHELKKGP